MSFVSSNTPRLLALCLFVGLSLGATPTAAQERPALDRDVHAAIQLLLNTSPAAKRLASSAKGALVFPNIVKAGFLVGRGQTTVFIVTHRPSHLKMADKIIWLEYGSVRSVGRPKVVMQKTRGML